MAEPQETQQEKEARWAAYRTTQNTQHRTYQAARTRARARGWMIVGAIAIIVAVIVVLWVL